MQAMRTLFLLATICLAAGCSVVTANHPLYFAHEKTFDPDLLGKWDFAEEDRDNSDSCTIEKAQIDGGWGYRIRGDKPEDEVRARLVSVRGGLYVDVQGAVSDEAEHTIVRLRKEGNGFVVQMLDPDFVKQYLQEHPRAVAHNADKDVLTAKTRSLRNFIWKLERYPKAWNTALRFTRPANSNTGGKP